MGRPGGNRLARRRCSVIGVLLGRIGDSSVTCAIDWQRVRYGRALRMRSVHGNSLGAVCVGMAGLSSRHVVMRAFDIVRDRGVDFAGPRLSTRVLRGLGFCGSDAPFRPGICCRGSNPRLPPLSGEFVKTAGDKGQHLQDPPDNGGWGVTPRQTQGRSGARVCPTPYTAADIPYRHAKTALMPVWFLRGMPWRIGATVRGTSSRRRQPMQPEGAAGRVNL